MRTRFILRIENRLIRTHEAVVDLARVLPGGPLTLMDVAIDLGGYVLRADDPAGHLFDARAREVVRQINEETGLPAGMDLHLGAGEVTGLTARVAADGALRLWAIGPEDYPQGPEEDVDVMPLRRLLSTRQIEALACFAEMAA